MSVLLEVLAHPSNVGRRWRTLARWTAHNVRRRLSPIRVVTTRVAGRFLTGPVDHPCVCFAVYVPGGGHEFDAFWALEHLIESGDVFVDVGANIGLYAVQVDRLLGPEGHILAIEPAADQVAFLHHNLSRLDAEVTVIESAVADREREVTFESPGPDLGFLALHEAGSTRLVVTTTIDAILRREGLSVRPPRCVIKLDIEGWEPAALQGAEGLLRTGEVKAILVEARDHQHRSPVAWSWCVDRLHDWGYRFVWPQVREGRLHEFQAPPTRSPFGDYLVVSPEGYDRLDAALVARRGRQ